MKTVCIVGTRPEAIKMAPVIACLRADPSRFDTVVMATGQHRALLDSVLRVFSIRPEVDLNVMTPDQSLASLAARILDLLNGYLDKERPDIVLAQGDTTSVMAAATACFLRGIRFGHVEAGLRTGSLSAPFPEEFNRRVVALAACHHFAPTEQARRNLLREGVDPAAIHVTGNTIVDAVRFILQTTQPGPRPFPPGQAFILMTCHRRESFGQKIRTILETVREFALSHPNMIVWYPVHPNPNVTGPAHEILKDLPNVVLSEPVDYVSFLHAIKDSILLLTDSGGMQEEGVTLGKPVLVLRDVTERPEGVEAGVCRLVGTRRESILEQLNLLLSDRTLYTTMCRSNNVFGDGHAAGKIVSILSDTN